MENYVSPLLWPPWSNGESGQSFQDSVLAEVTLQQAVEYSIKHQAVILQALADEQIREANIRIRLSDWYTQFNYGYNYQHNFVLPTSDI